MKTEFFLTFANRHDRELKVPRWLAFRLSYWLKSVEHISITVRSTAAPGAASLEDGKIRNVSMREWDFLKVL